MAYDSEWRTQVNQQLTKNVETQQQTAVILERINGLVTEHDHRIKRLEEQPTDWRSGISSYGGCFGQMAFAILSLASFVIMLVTVLAQHWK